MLNRVAAVGFGSTSFSREKSQTEQKLLEATADLFNNVANLSQSDVDTVLVSSMDNTKYLSAILSESSGISPRISQSVENMCSSGTSAIISGVSYVASGLADIVLVVGADRFDSPGRVLDWDVSRGRFSHPIYWASLFASAYKRESGATDEDLAAVPAKNHRHAKDNPDAYSKSNITIQDVMDSKRLTDDIRLYDCSMPCTGAAAILLASETAAKQLTDSPVWISGIGQKNTSARFAKSGGLANMTSITDAKQAAFSMAKKTPQDVDVTELHDAFSVCEPMALEALGLASKNCGYKMSKAMFDTHDNSVNPRGGLIGAGHPLGATGIAQTIEIVSQLQGRSKKRQVQNAKTGLVHNMSAAATSSTVLVLES